MKKEFNVGDRIRAVGGLCIKMDDKFKSTGAPFLDRDFLLEVVKSDIGDTHVKVRIVENKCTLSEALVKTVGTEGFISPRQVTHRLRKKGAA